MKNFKLFEKVRAKWPADIQFVEPDCGRTSDAYWEVEEVDVGHPLEKGIRACK